MTVQRNISVKLKGELHLELYFECAGCGEMICSTGIANDYHYPQWYVGNPISFTEEGLVCYSCLKGADIENIKRIFQKV